MTFDEYLDSQLYDPEFRAAYEQARKEIDAIDREVNTWPEKCALISSDPEAKAAFDARIAELQRRNAIGDLSPIDEEDEDVNDMPPLL